MPSPRINNDGDVEEFNLWTEKWEVWYCPHCGVKQCPEGYAPHLDSCPLQ